MIGRLRGMLIWKQAPHLLLDVQGVGYEIEAPMTTFYELPPVGSEITLHTHLAVREDAHLLFGFATERERVLFRQLLKVNGIGAKMALTILSIQLSCRPMDLLLRQGISVTLIMSSAQDLLGLSMMVLWTPCLIQAAASPVVLFARWP